RGGRLPRPRRYRPRRGCARIVEARGPGRTRRGAHVRRTRGVAGRPARLEGPTDRGDELPRMDERARPAARARTQLGVGAHAPLPPLTREIRQLFVSPGHAPVTRAN